MFIQGNEIKLNKDLDKNFSLRELIQEDIEYVFRGDFTPEIVAGILDLAKTTLERSYDTVRIKAKIYFINHGFHRPILPNQIHNFPVKK